MPDGGHGEDEFGMNRVPVAAVHAASEALWQADMTADPSVLAAVALEAAWPHIGRSGGQP